MHAPTRFGAVALLFGSGLSALGFGGSAVALDGAAWQQSAASAGSCEQSVVVPVGLRDVEGNASTSFPFGSSGPIRVMYAYDREASGLDRTVRICGVRCRPNAGIGSYNGAALDFRLELSTGRNPAGSLDFAFANNHGADRVTVFDGVLNVPPANNLGTSPNPFVLDIPFSVPFEWDPSFGPLLFDFQHRGATGGPLLQWDVDTSVVGTTRIAATTGGATAPVANFPSGSTPQAAGLVVDLCLETQTVPSALTGTSGNSSSSYPWSRQTPMRVQYIYDESTIDLVGRHKIHSLSFRPNNGAAFSGASYDIRITMSTCPTIASAFSSTFAQNHGDDAQVVFDGIYQAPPATGGADRFELIVPLENPFEYNPALGPLVIDCQLRSGDITTSFDGSFNQDPVYRVYNLASDTAASGTTQTFGLVLGLNAEPIPTIPESNDATIGSSSSSFPWNGVPMRVMYRYGPNQIATDAPIYIQHLSWRPRLGASGSFGPAAYTCTIDLSSANSSGALDPTFDNNHGPDRTRVFDGTFSAPYLEAGSDPAAMEVVVKLEEPFYYDPASGPLLLDLRVYDTVGDTIAFDGSFAAGLDRIADQNNPDGAVATFGPQGFGLSLRLGGATCNATSVPYGVGCAGSNGTPRCVNEGLPTLPADDFRIRLLQGVPSSAGFLILALTQTAIPLDALGATGCFGLTGGEIGAEGFALSAAGEAERLIALPNNPAFAGLQFTTQWAVLDLPANALGLTFSDALLHTTCY